MQLADEAMNQLGLTVEDYLGTPLTQDQMTSANNQLFATVGNMYKRIRLGGVPVTSGTRSGVLLPKKMKKKTTRTYKKKSVSLTQKMKQIALRQHEIKNCNNGSSANLLHAQQQAINITAAVVQGSNVEQRVGDEITLNALRMVFDLAAPTTAGAYSYRVMVVYHDADYSPTTFSTSSISYSEVFLPGAVSGSNSMGIVNKKAVQVLYDGLVCINSNIAATADHVQFPVTVNLRNIKFPYKATGSLYGKYKNLYVLVVPFVIGGVNDTTGCGTVILNYSLDFRDA